MQYAKIIRCTFVRSREIASPCRAAARTKLYFFKGTLFWSCLGCSFVQFAFSPRTTACFSSRPLPLSPTQSRQTEGSVGQFRCWTSGWYQTGSLLTCWSLPPSIQPLFDYWMTACFGRIRTPTYKLGRLHCCVLCKVGVDSHSGTEHVTLMWKHCCF